MTEIPMLFVPGLVPSLIDCRKGTTLRPITAQNSLVNGSGVRRFLEGYDWARAFVDPGPSPAGNAGPYLHVPRAIESGGVFTFEVDWVQDRIYPRAAVGDRIWCRETWRDIGYRPESDHLIGYMAGGEMWQTAPEDYQTPKNWKAYRPSIHMPRWACRWTSPPLVSVEPVRLDLITEVQAIDDGILAMPDDWLRRTFPAWAAAWSEWDAAGRTGRPPVGPSPLERMIALLGQIYPGKQWFWLMRWA